MPTLLNFPNTPVLGQTHTLTDTGRTYVCTKIDPDSIWAVQSLEANVLGNDTVDSANIANDAVGISELNAAQETTVADDAGKVLTVNSTGMGIEWSNNPSSFTAGGLPGVLNLDGFDTTTTQNASFTASGDFIIVTGCGAGGLGGFRTGGSENRGGGGGSGGGVSQAKVYVTAGATYDVVCATDYIVNVASGVRSTADVPATTIALNGGSTILSLGGGGHGQGQNAAGGGSAGTVTATEGTSTGQIDPGAIVLDGNPGRTGGTDRQNGKHQGGSGIFGSRNDTGVNLTTGEYQGNQRGRGLLGTQSAGNQTGKGGFITILY